MWTWYSHVDIGFSYRFSFNYIITMWYIISKENDRSCPCILYVRVHSFLTGPLCLTMAYGEFWICWKPREQWRNSIAILGLTMLPAGFCSEFPISSEQECLQLLPQPVNSALIVRDKVPPINLLTFLKFHIRYYLLKSFIILMFPHLCF